MKETRTYVKEWLNTFIYIFGFMQIAFILRQFLPHSGGNVGLHWYEISDSFFAALVFSASHFAIHSDLLDSRISVKQRIICCGIPCALAGLRLSYNLGLQDFIPRSTNTVVASVVWMLSYLVSLAIYMGIFFAIELRLKKQSKRYNAALEKYKKESNSNLVETI